MTNEQAEELFRTYKKTGDIAIRNKLVENYMYVAEILAKKQIWAKYLNIGFMINILSIEVQKS